MKILRLFLAFLKVGAFTFGGGYAAVPLIRETVLANGWLDDARLSELIAVSESTPGPIMVNLATYIGSVQAGVPGAIAATLAVVLPAFVVILLLTKALKKALTSEGFRAAFGTLRPTIAGIILATGVFLALNNVIGSVQAPVIDWKALLLTALLAAVYFASRKFTKRGMSPILLILLSGAAGIALYAV
ncbi:MAG: chromate transporter [Clostridia bacterium]|nr:chromate transporter [Clostridia bacterium]